MAEYLERTQAALADLPASEVEEILEDIGPHLAEIAEELGEDVSVEALIERLGTPEEYASELRAAGGYPPAEPAPRPGGAFLSRLALWLLAIGVLAWFVAGLAGIPRNGTPVAIAVVLTPLLAIAWFLIFTGRAPVIAGLAESRAGRRVLDSVPPTVMTYLRTLRPAWWLARIVVLGAGAVLALSRGRAEYVLMTVVALAAVIAFGTRARSDDRWRWVIAPANAFAVGLGIAMIVGGFGQLAGSENQRGYPAPYPAVVSEAPQNVYAFGPDGKPLPEVYLYDENGQPIMGQPETCAREFPGPSNKFPQPRIEFDSIGKCHELTGVPFTVAIPTSSPPAPSTTTAPPPSSTAAQTTTAAPPSTK